MIKLTEFNSAPYPWFGGKGRIADIVWDRFGNPDCYIEPFFGSGAVFLRRPIDITRKTSFVEIINDIDGNITNFWRAIKQAPSLVAKSSDRPINELDLHAVGQQLFISRSSLEFTEKLRKDINMFDPERAGKWVWFVANWIGGLPETGSERLSRRMPHLYPVHGIMREFRGHNNDLDSSVRRQKLLLRWFDTLSDRFRSTRILCGDWERCLGKSVTTQFAGGEVAIFLDPPYSKESGRGTAKKCYTFDDYDISHKVRDYCLTMTSPKVRICLAGYGDEHAELEEFGWSRFNWSTAGGYGKIGGAYKAKEAKTGKLNSKRENLWFSPNCTTKKKKKIVNF